MSKSPKKGAADIAALKAKLGVKGPAQKGPPSGASATVAEAVTPPKGTPAAAPRGAPAPGSQAPVVAPPGARGIAGPTAARRTGPAPTVLPPGMAPPPGSEPAPEAARPTPIKVSGVIDSETAAAGGIGGGKLLQRVMMATAPAVFFAIIGWTTGTNNASRNVMNARVDAAVSLYDRMETTHGEVIKVKKNFDKFFATIKEKGDKDFSERLNFSSYMAGLELSTFMDDASINNLTAFMDEGLVTRLLSYYQELSGFIALANHHGHVVAVHADDLRKANEAAKSFSDLRYVVKVPMGDKGPKFDGVLPGMLGVADFELVDPKAKDKEIKEWTFRPGTGDDIKVETLGKFGVAVVLDESKKGILEPRNRSLLREFNGRLGAMSNMLKKIVEDGKKILTGPENTLEAEKNKARVFAL